MTIGEKQKKFVELIGKLIKFAYENGYEFTFGEAWRPPVTAEYYAKLGKGSKNSLHCDRLAIDLNLFKGGVYQTKSEAYMPLGIFWEGLATPQFKTAWGGRFGDGNHFSIVDGNRA